MLSLQIQRAFSLIYFPTHTMTTSEINGSLNVAQGSTFSSALLCLNHCQPFPLFYVYVALVVLFFIIIILYKGGQSLQSLSKDYFCPKKGGKNRLTTRLKPWKRRQEENGSTKRRKGIGKERSPLGRAKTRCKWTGGGKRELA